MAVYFGIKRSTALVVESISIEKKCEVATLRGTNGNTKFVKEFDRTTDFTIKTRGEESALDVGVGDPGISGLTGGVVMIPSVKLDETNIDFPSSEASGTHFPNATEVTDD